MNLIFNHTINVTDSNNNKLTELYKEKGAGKNGINKMWADMKSKATAQANFLIASIEEYTQKNDSEENW